MKGKEAIRVDYHFYTYQDYNSTLNYTAGQLGGAHYFSPSDMNLFRKNLGAYYLMSIGPMATESKTDTIFWTQYDPTNGCVSEGSIFVSQKYTEPVIYDFSPDIQL